MLESTLESLLLRYLAPYVDGISRDHLHLGVFSGSLELKGLRVRPDALALLGWEGLRVRSGTIRSIRLAVPWSKLYTGKVKAVVESLHLEVETIADSAAADQASLIDELRAAKRKAIEVRVDQLRDQVHALEEGDEGGKPARGAAAGAGVRLARKIVNNITVELSDVNISFLNDRRGLACGMEFPSLDVLSTDRTFKERSETEVLDTTGMSMYKLLRLRGLGFRMAAAGSCDMSGAEYMLSPINASLQLSHVPSDQTLRLRLEVATEALAEVTLVRSQVKRLRGVQNELALEELRLRGLLVSPEDERSIYEDVQASLSEYGRLFEKLLIHEWRKQPGAAEHLPEADPMALAPLWTEEARRMQVMEDVLSSRIIARERWKVHRKVEALTTEVARRKSAAEAEQAASRAANRGGFLSRLRGLRDSGESASETEAQRSLISPDELDQLMRDLEDESKVESVDLPTRLCFEFLLGQMALNLVDDRRAAPDPQRQLLHMQLNDATWNVDVHLKADHRGQDSAEWRTEICLGAFHAHHAGKALMRPHRDSEGFLQTTDNALVGGQAARLEVQSLCQKDHNLMKLCFEFKPLEVHMLPGVAASLLEFFHTPEPDNSLVSQKAEGLSAAECADRAFAGRTRDLHVEDGVEIAKQWLEAHHVTGKGVAETVCERMPDKFHLEVSVASPILFVPVEGLGTSAISLGELHIVTPTACEYHSVDLEMVLNHTSLRADTSTGERFEMIQPAPVRLAMEYRSSKERNAVHVRAQVEELAVSLAPQAVQILLATPSSFFEILYEQEDSGTPGAAPGKAAEGFAVSPPPAVHRDEVVPASPPRPLGAGGVAHVSSPWTPETPASASALQRAAAVAEEVLIAEGSSGLLQAVAQRAREAQSRQFKLDLAMEFNALTVTLADSISPVMRFRAELLSPGLVMHKQTLPALLALNVGTGALEVEVLNTRSGEWEPMLERCSMGLELERKVLDEDMFAGDVEAAAAEVAAASDERATRVILTGHEPVRVTLTPTGVRRASWILPLFAESFSAPPPKLALASPEEGEGALSCVGAVKYRVLNLCDDAVLLTFRSKHRDGLVLEVPPTGSYWRSLDEQVLPNFVTAVIAQAKGSSVVSEPLPLERCGAVAIPNCGYVAELLAPDPTHRLLLLATPLRIHNSTDLTLLVRFHDAAQQGVLPLPLRRTSVCEASLLGRRPPPGSVPIAAATAPPGPSQVGGAAVGSECLQLPPGSCCAVPASAAVCAQGGGCRTARAWFSIRPLGTPAMFCSAVEAGARLPAVAALCPSEQQAAAQQPPPPAPDEWQLVEPDEGFHFLCESDASLHFLPAPLETTTIVIQPALSILNALPIGNLFVRYGPGFVGGARVGEGAGNPRNGGNQKALSREAIIPRFSRLNVYDVPPLRSDGVAVAARLDGQAAPWSQNMAAFGPDALLRGEADAEQPLPLRLRSDGAAAGVTVEPIGHCQLRVACPAWLADRSGIERPIAVSVLHKGRPLPSRDGVTLLPAEHTEESCELALTSADTSGPILPPGAPGASGTVKEVRLPPNWATLPWQTPCGAFVFSLQADDVVREDVLGARCQVLTLRPRLVLTNAAEDVELEVKFVEGGAVLKLPPGGSLAHHWPPRPGDEELPSCTLRFRPMRSDACNWSGALSVGDPAAGSTPFALAVVGGGDVVVAEVWSAEVAPDRGALAVTFRPGSTFVAANQSSNPDLVMCVRPSRCDESFAEVHVPPGAEVPYGWAQPFMAAAATQGKDKGAPAAVSRHTVEVVVRDVKGRGKKEARLRVKDVRKTARYLLRDIDAEIVVSRTGCKTSLTLVDHRTSVHYSRGGGRLAPNDGSKAKPRSGGLADGATPSFQLDVKFSGLGISLVDELPVPRESLYFSMDLIRAEYRRLEDDCALKFTISEAQVDCQLPGRGAEASSTGSPVGGRGGNPQGKDQGVALFRRDNPVTIFANAADGDRAFLTVFMQRSAMSSRDVVVPFMEIAVDALELTIDDGWLDPFVAWCAQVSSTSGGHGRGGPGLSYAEVARRAGRPITDGYMPPELPSVIQVDSMHISSICLTAWCSLKLKTIQFLPPYVRAAMRVLSLSGHFTLDGATLKLKERVVPPHRGSLGDFVRGLASQYTSNLLKIAGNVLGKSSVLKLPRVTFGIGMSYVGESVGVLAGEAASLVNLLTFDDGYVAKQRQLRSEKRISNVSDGLAEAGKSLSQGVEGFMDIFTKPIEGARRDGVGGFFAGGLKGLAGTVVKPVSKLGQAISEVGSGIAAQVATDTALVPRRRQRPRIRLPRLLFTEFGAVRPWNELEARLLQQFGSDALRGVEEVLPLTQSLSSGTPGRGPRGIGGANAQMVLLLFQRRLALVTVEGFGAADGEDVASAASSSSGSAATTGLKAAGGFFGPGLRQAAGSSSGSSSGPRADQRGYPGAGGAPSALDVRGTFEESGNRVLSHVFKPLNSVMSSVQDMERSLLAAGGCSGLVLPGGGASSSDAGRGGRHAMRGKYWFRNMNNASVTDDGLLQFEDSAVGPVSLPLQASPLGPAARQALGDGLKAAAAHHEGIAYWGTLREALREEQRRGAAEDLFLSKDKAVAGGRQGAWHGAGLRILEVFEVERKDLRRDLSQQWVTPYLLVDKEMSWRWLDSTGARHPHIFKGMSREAVAKQKEPPCGLDGALFKPRGDWVIDRSEGSDPHGWKYGIAWNSSTWEAQPGLFNGIRRRRWTRTFS